MEGFIQKVVNLFDILVNCWKNFCAHIILHQCSSSVKRLPFWNLGFHKELSKCQEWLLASPADNTIPPKIWQKVRTLLWNVAGICGLTSTAVEADLLGEGTKVTLWTGFCDITAKRERERERERRCLLLSVGGPSLFLESLFATRPLSSPVGEKLSEYQDVRKATWAAGLVFHWISSAEWVAPWVTLKLFKLNSELDPFISCE